jgi:hypothetical protein
MGKSFILSRSSLLTNRTAASGGSKGGNKKTGLWSMTFGHPFNLKSTQARLPANLTEANTGAGPTSYPFPIGWSRN